MKVKYVPFGGGLDTEAPAILKPAGSIIGSSNYEAGLLGGYERAPGFERFDGQPAPRSADVTVLAGTFTTTVGTIATGLTSSATGTVVLVEPGVIVLTKVTGTFAVGETLRVAGIPIGVVASELNISALNLNRYTAACEAIFRALIASVPGSGPVRGVATLGSTVYATRNNAGGTAQAIYRSTATGWVLVPLLFEVAFTAGSGVEPVEGATITKGAVSAVVRRVVTQTGEWGTSNAAGRFIINAPTNAPFTAGALTAGATATLSGAETAITLNPGGKWIWRRYNFNGSADTLRLYGVDGANKPVEFDGTVLVPLNTGQTGAFPTCIEVHKNHLFVSYRASVQNSGISDPYRWTILSGANELALGDSITNLLSVTGGTSKAALLVTCNDRYGVLYGNDTADFELVSISSEVGARAFSIQELGPVIGVDADGARSFATTFDFGNFLATTITAHIQRQAVNLVPVASITDRKRSRVRFFMADGRVLTGTPGKRWAWAWSDYPVQVNVAHEGEVAEVSRQFLGAEDGFVYEITDCRSFDGVDIESWFKLTYTHMGSPGMRKHFKNFAVEMRASSAGRFNFQAEFSYGDSDTDPNLLATEDSPAPPIQWDVDAWDSGVWDGQFAKTVRVRNPGVGENVSMTFHQKAATELPHELTGCNVTFFPRRLER